MSIFVTTQSYRGDEPTTFGLLCEIDNKTGEILNSLSVNTPIECDNENERIKPGLRGIYGYNNKIYTTTWNKIVIIDRENLKIEQEFSHSWMSDLHGIFVDENGIWVTSSLPDCVILYGFDGEVKSSLWIPETLLYKNRTIVDKEMDWRYKGKDFRGFREFHCNHIEKNGGVIFITGRGKGTNGRVIKVNIESFLKKKYVKDEDISMFAKKLHGPHDGIWFDSFFWVTETNGSTVCGLDRKGKVRIRKKIKESEEQTIKYNSISDRIKSYLKEKFLNKPGRKITHWTRGLCFNNDAIFVGQSTWAGEVSSKARIIKLDRKTRKIKNCFYLSIPDYPETRIFQIWAHN
ncbi:MAG: hypothetical protein ACFFC1_14850 [Promethearchaeota archaeon]